MLVKNEVKTYTSVADIMFVANDFESVSEWDQFLQERVKSSGAAAIGFTIRSHFQIPSKN